jgi:glycosyltransferase involved in cell wall biosynthesis
MDKKLPLTHFAENFIDTEIGDASQSPFAIRKFALAAEMAGYMPGGKPLMKPKYKKSPVDITVTCEGLVYGMSGFAQAMRNIVYSLDGARVNTCVDPLDGEMTDNVDVALTQAGKVIKELSGYQIDSKKKKVRIIMTVPEGVKRKRGDEYTIAYVMFETQKFPQSFIKSLEQNCDEIWTPSKFNVKNIKEAGWYKPIYCMPLGVDTKHFDPDKVKPLSYLESPIGLFKDKFIFLSIMGWSERKGVSRLIEAYLKEFTPKDKTILYIKGGWYDKVKAWEQVKNIARLIKQQNGPEIYLDFNIYPDTYMPRLYKSANAFVLPSLGEGFGLNYAEAMAMELPTIGTAATSMLDFMNTVNSFPVKVKGFKTEPRCDWVTPAYIGAKFAIPDIDDLRKQMRDVHNYRNGYLKQPEYARKTIVEDFSLKACAKRYIKRLKEL